MTGPDTAPVPSSVLRIVRGNPTATDIAAVTAVLLAARRPAGDPADAPTGGPRAAGWDRTRPAGGPVPGHRPAGSWQAPRSR